MVDTVLFRKKAPDVMKKLIDAFEISDFQAAGILGNLGTECAGFHVLHEIGQPEGKGGYGWGQWTGPRRKSFLNWCHQENLDWKSDEANQGYLHHELSTSYSRSVSSLLKAKNVDEAVVSFERTYEQAGEPHMDNRKWWGHLALDAFRGRA